MKNSKKREAALVAGGIVLGIAITGPAAQAAEILTAQRSTQKIYVDGQQVQMEAYSINGANFVKLRDIGKKVGFNVTWDGSAVQIDSTAPYQDDAMAQSSRVVTLPTDGTSKYVPKVGDLIPCDDGTLYEVNDVIRRENNVFMDGPMPDMPTPTCGWSLFPARELPKVEARHSSDQYGDDLFVRNLYELRRMQYTIYNALGKEPSAWRDGKPLATVQLTTPAEYEAYTAKFWPWRGSDLVNLVHSCPNSRYYIDAWDYYHNGIFQYTRYCVLSL